jgi:hypothetical protein
VRGDAPGLVHVISAMEACPSYKPWLDKSNGHVECDHPIRWADDHVR